MPHEIDLRTVAVRLADVGPIVALNGGTMREFEELTRRPEIVEIVAQRVGETERAEAWLEGLRVRARESLGDPDGDHALLVGALSALGSLIIDERPEQATAAFEAVSLV